MSFEELRRDFERKGIDVSAPGFYDQPAFRASETLDLYAEFVLAQPYSAEYLAYAKSEVEALTRFIFEQVQRSGRVGACVDASELIQRLLERRGVWCFTVKGGVTIHYKSEGANLPDGYYWPWSLNGQYDAGHCWVVAPPYQLIDATIYLETYLNGEQAYLPQRVLEEHPQPGNVEAVDIMMYDEFWQVTGEEMTLESIARRDPTLLPRIEKWGVKLADYPRCTIKYIPVDMSASQYRLEEMEDNIECGTLPTELLKEYEASRS
ncbi:hypothetical protein BH11ARM2_BH11ARM2_21870 [soil metagenome]